MNNRPPDCELDNKTVARLEHKQISNRFGLPSTVYDEEVVADAMQTMLSDEKDTVINTLRDLNSENPGLFKKLKQKLDQFAESLHRFYNEMKNRGKSLSTEAKIVSQMGDEVDELRKLFAEALNTAGKNFSMSGYSENNGGSKYSSRNYYRSKPTIDSYTEEQYNNFGWIAVNGVLTVEEYGSLMHQFDDFNNRKHQYPVTKDGEALIITYDKEHNATKIAAIKGTTANPIVTMVIEIDTVAVPSYLQGYYLEDVIENGEYSENIAIIQAVEGQRVFSIKSQQDYSPYSDLRRQRRSSKKGRRNSESLLYGSGSGEENTGTEYLNTEPSSTDGGFSDGRMFSFRGEKSQGADLTALGQAKQMFESGESSENIRQATGWFKGYDGKWRYEIDDSKMELTGELIKFVDGTELGKLIKHNELFAAYPQLKNVKVRVLDSADVYGSADPDGNDIYINSRLLQNTDAEKKRNEIFQSDEYKDYREKLAQLYKARELASKPLLERFVEEASNGNAEAAAKARDEYKNVVSEYDKQIDQLTEAWSQSELGQQVAKLSEKSLQEGEQLSEDAKYTLIHEIQHFIQYYESFANGSIPEEWERKIYDALSQKKKEAESKLLKYATPENNLKELIYQYDERISRINGDDSDALRRMASAYDAIAKKINDEDIEEAFFEYSNATEEFVTAFAGDNLRSKGMEYYRRTAGEVESRDVENRLNMTAEQRKNTRPDIDRTDVVFAEGGAVRLSMREGESRKLDTDYMSAVESGDMETAQSMVDEAAAIWADGEELYGAADEDTGEISNVFYRSRDGGRTFWGNHGNNSADGVFLTSSPYVADAFGTDGHITVFAKAKRVFEIDAAGQGYAGIPVSENMPDWLLDKATQDVVYNSETGEYETELSIDIDRLYPLAFSQGYDAVKVTNVREGVGGGTATDVVLKDGGTQMKSADSVTYDDNGEVIPLSKRFDSENEDIRYSGRTDVLSWDIDWDANNESSIKNQIVSHLDEINRQKIVHSFTFDKTVPYATALNNILKNWGYKVETQKYGTFLFDSKGIANLRRYVNNDAEAAAAIAAPYVVKRGIVISGHKNHNNNGNPSVTFAGRVSINGKVGIVGVAILFGDKNRVHSMRILTPDGKEFSIIKDDTEMAKGGSSNKRVDSPTKSMSSKNYVNTPTAESQPKTSSTDSGRRNSLRDSEGRTLTTAQQEYFADSKIRDEDGNLLVVYHGSAQTNVVADAMQTMFSDEKDTVINTLRDLNSENPGLFKKLKQKLDQFAKSLHRFYNEMKNRGKSLSTEAKIVSQMGDEVDELRKLFAEALNTAGKNFSTAQENVGESETMRSERTAEGFEDYDKPITLEDIQKIRSIGRKSVNKFTDADIKATQKWAYKFYQQMGTKSPFFRA